VLPRDEDLSILRHFVLVATKEEMISVNLGFSYSEKYACPVESTRGDPQNGRDVS
jgi:hypothetical protein